MDPIGNGGFQNVPAATANGTLLAPPARAIGIEFYLKAADSVTFVLAAAQPSAVPVSGAALVLSGATGSPLPAVYQFNINFGLPLNAYVTALSGTPQFRFV